MVKVPSTTTQDALSLLRAASDELLELFAPPRCVACDEPASKSPSFCRACLSQIERCDDPMESGVFAPFVQHGPLVRAVHRAKFGARPAPARAMGLLLADALGSALDEVDVVVPVPLHAERLRARTFNQAAEIAKTLGKPVSFGALIRAKTTRPQATLDRDERRSNVRDAFTTVRRSMIEGRRVLLVDDVVTTGATLDAARSALVEAGPLSVRSAAVARAVLRSATLAL
ncbi:MAG: phosphoribosyltransferase family protein [Polyangiales bacterium]